MDARLMLEGQTGQDADLPPIIKIGMKTATSEMLIESTVKPISRAPRSAASIDDSPASR